MWNGGDLQSTGGTRATTLVYTSLTVPAVDAILGLTPVPRRNFTDLVILEDSRATISNNRPGTTQTIEFVDGAGIIVEGQLLVTGTGSIALSNSGDGYGELHVQGRGWVNIDVGNNVFGIAMVYVQSSGRTELKSGTMSIQHADLDGNMARIDGGVFYLYGDATVTNIGKTFLVGDGSLVLLNSSVNKPATIKGKLTTLNGTVQFSGDPIGYLVVRDLSLSGKLKVQVDFTNLSGDQIDADNNATLGGDLSVSMTGNYAANKTFELVTAGGAFDGKFNKPITKPQGTNFDVTYNVDNAELTS